MKNFAVNFDAWSQGQIKSKLWLCEALEKYYDGPIHPTIWILGGWYGLLAFLLFSRDRLQPSQICQFDLDETANATALMVNNNWTIQEPKQFKVFKQDASELNYQNANFGAAPDILINTACEHFENSWLHLVPKNTFVVAQSTNMEHHEHINRSQNLKEIQSQLKSQIETRHAAQLDFNYTEIQFSRFMVMGRKT